MNSTSAESKTREGPPDLTMFAPKGGYLYRDEVPKVPLGEQLIWIAKLKAHPGKRGEMVDFALKHANNVHRTEGDCLSFLVLESTQDEETVVLFERYTSEEFFEKTHRTSESMKEYQANVSSVRTLREEDDANVSL